MEIKKRLIQAKKHIHIGPMGNRSSRIAPFESEKRSKVLGRFFKKRSWKIGTSTSELQVGGKWASQSEKR